MFIRLLTYLHRHTGGRLHYPDHEVVGGENVPLRIFIRCWQRCLRYGRRRVCRPGRRTSSGHGAWNGSVHMERECPSGVMRLVVVALIDCIQSSSSDVASAVCRSSSLVRRSISQLPDGAGESRSRETRSLPVGRLMSVLFRSRPVVGTTR